MAINVFYIIITIFGFAVMIFSLKYLQIIV